MFSCPCSGQSTFPVALFYIVVLLSFFALSPFPYFHFHKSDTYIPPLNNGYRHLKRGYTRPALATPPSPPGRSPCLAYLLLPGKLATQFCRLSRVVYSHHPTSNSLHTCRSKIPISSLHRKRPKYNTYNIFKVDELDSIE